MIVDIMKNLKETIAEFSQSLQCLMEPTVFPEVQNAVERKDKNLLFEVCRKMKIPEVYMSIIVSVLLSVSPQQTKWPLPEW